MSAAGVSPEILRQVRLIELRTRGLVDSRTSGGYHSVFKGHGLEFAEVREYVPGDDVRALDWNVTARTGRPFVKKHVEERDLAVLMAVDLSGSQRWGSAGRFKVEQVAEVAAVLALSAVRNNDRVGLLTFTDRVEGFVPPRKGRRHALRIVRDLLAAEPEGRGTDLAASLRYATRLLPSRAIVFVFSDFQLGSGWPDAERALALAAARHDVVAVSVADPAEAALPPVGLLHLRDPETGRTVLVDSSSAATRERVSRMAAEERERRRNTFRRLGIDEVEVAPGSPYAPALLSFFRSRELRRGR